jgi:hypothetical protein
MMARRMAVVPQDTHLAFEGAPRPSMRVRYA